MTTLFAQRQHFPMNASPYNVHSQSTSSSHASHSSPRMFNSEDAPLAGAGPRPSHYGSPYLQHENSARPRTQSPLQISTTASSAQEHEPEEETAHPSRMQTQLQHGGAEAEAREPAQQASTSSLRDGPSSSAVPPHNPPSLTAGHGFGNLDEGLSRPLTLKERDLLAHLDRLKFFLATAPSRWTDGSGPDPGNPSALPVGHPNSAHPALNRFLLPNSEYVSCVLWGGLYHITGTDIVRALVFRFEAFGRPVKNMKKFEEGVFSDLRNLKPGVDACLEEPKSPFLDLLFKYQCIRTQKKQKVFYWFSVPHDRLFLDALERDLKREKMGLEPTTAITGEPALSFTYDPKRSLYDQFSKATGGVEGEGELEAAVRRADEARSASGSASPSDLSAALPGASDKQSDAEMSSSEAEEAGKSADERLKGKSALHGPNSPFFSMFSLFEGSPTYKQRRKKVPKRGSPSLLGMSPYMADSEDYFGAAPPPAVAPMRPQEPQMDRYGRDTTRLSAADMFIAQARGDFGPQSNPDLIASQRERQRRAMLAHADQLAGKGYIPGGEGSGMHHQLPPMRTSPESIYPGHSPMVTSGVLGMEHEMAARPHVEQRHTYPLPNHPAYDRSRANTQPYGHDINGQWSVTGETIPIQRTKAFVCPLFSCGRMFKRQEHLKRHLRTHTLERPYQCQRCKKRFSRSDNLNQHLRTHTRADGSEIEGEADVESEDVDELDGDEAALEYINGLDNMPDVQMCEVEIQGQVQEVQGDEDGLVVPASSLTHSASAGASVDEAQEIYYTDGSTGLLLDASPEQGAFVNTNSPGSQWATARSHPSPAFSTVSMPSPSLSSSYGSSYVGDYVSMSAPSHKQSFDHANLYLPAVELANGPGPIRRHRSATPSVTRYNENARRPYTASESSRSYHPYAVAAHSADSSPMAYSVPLAYEGSPQLSGLARPALHHRTHSRSSSTGQQLQEQLDQMLNLEPALDAAAAFGPEHAVVGAQAYAGMYRTDSPMQFAAAQSAYEVDPDAQTQGMFPMSLGDPQSNVAPYGSHMVDGGLYNGMAHHAMTM